MALPFQDKRDDDGHAEVTLIFAKKLVEIEKGDGDIIVPAIILHDTGWSRVPREEWIRIFDIKMSKEERIPLQLKHQKESVKIAREILGKTKYPKDLAREILEIISQHDTRKVFISKNEGLVRDADKLWRFSKIGFGKDIKRFDVLPADLCGKLEKDIEKEGFFYSSGAKNLAREELTERKKEYAI